MRIDVHFHDCTDHAILARIEQAIQNLTRKVDQMAGVREALDNVIAKVTRIEGQADSIISTVVEIAGLLRENAADPAEINALADRLEAKATAISDAVQANDPTPPTP